VHHEIITHRYCRVEQSRAIPVIVAILWHQNQNHSYDIYQSQSQRRYQLVAVSGALKEWEVYCYRASECSEEGSEESINQRWTLDDD
jgi:hypothetical protein